jgi:hypothetical protein
VPLFVAHKLSSCSLPACATGFLFGEYHGHQGGEFQCVDSAAMTYGSSADANGGTHTLSGRANEKRKDLEHCLNFGSHALTVDFPQLCTTGPRRRISPSVAAPPLPASRKTSSSNCHASSAPSPTLTPHLEVRFLFQFQAGFLLMAACVSRSQRSTLFSPCLSLSPQSPLE